MVSLATHINKHGWRAASPAPARGSSFRGFAPAASSLAFSAPIRPLRPGIFFRIQEYPLRCCAQWRQRSPSRSYRRLCVQGQRYLCYLCRLEKANVPRIGGLHLRARLRGAGSTLPPPIRGLDHTHAGDHRWLLLLSFSGGIYHRAATDPLRSRTGRTRTSGRRLCRLRHAALPSPSAHGVEDQTNKKHQCLGAAAAVEGLCDKHGSTRTQLRHSRLQDQRSAGLAFSSDTRDGATTPRCAARDHRGPGTGLRHSSDNITLGGFGAEFTSTSAARQVVTYLSGAEVPSRRDQLRRQRSDKSLALADDKPRRRESDSLPLQPSSGSANASSKSYDPLAKNWLAGAGPGTTCHRKTNALPSDYCLSEASRRRRSFTTGSRAARSRGPSPKKIIFLSWWESLPLSRAAGPALVGISVHHRLPL